LQRALLQPWGPEAEEQALREVGRTSLQLPGPMPLGERETLVREMRMQQRVRLLCVEAAFLVVLQVPSLCGAEGGGEGAGVSR
jgi:hypothetical protein